MHGIRIAVTIFDAITVLPTLSLCLTEKDRDMIMVSIMFIVLLVMNIACIWG